MTEELYQKFLEDNAYAIAMPDIPGDLLPQMAIAYELYQLRKSGVVLPSPSPGGEPPQPEPPPALPGAGYPDPVHANRHLGIRQIVFKDKYRIFKGQWMWTQRWKRNEADALRIVQTGNVFPKGDAVWCWYYSIDVDPHSQAWEVCALPGQLIPRRDTKVIWRADDIRVQLP
jgi:hypothetical protein